MKNIILSILLLLVCSISFAQNKFGNIDTYTTIVNEGKALYRTEKALELGIELFKEKHKNWDSASIGFLSYSVNNNLSRFVLYKKKSLKVSYTITFDSVFDVNSSEIDSTKRNFTTYEKNIYTINSKTNEIIRDSTYFIPWDETNFILIPIANENVKKVYVLTHNIVFYKDSSTIHWNKSYLDNMWLCSDYVLTFDENNNLANKRKLNVCNSNATISEDPDQANNNIYCDSITPDYICAVMLYEKKANWKTFSFFSENYHVIWDCTLNGFVDIINIRGDGFFSQCSNAWKNDSLRTNGFRWLLGHYLTNKGTNNFIGKPISEIVNWLGRPDRIDAYVADINDFLPGKKIPSDLSMHYYEYYLTPYPPITSGSQTLNIFVLDADLKVYHVSISTRDE